MVLVRSTADTEKDFDPDDASLDEMLSFNESLADAGILLAAQGLRPSKHGTRIAFNSDKTTTLTQGPFPPESTPCGYWIFKTKNMEEAIEWAKKIPFREGTIEIRPMLSPKDFENVTRELQLKESRMQKKVLKLFIEDEEEEIQSLE